MSVFVTNSYYSKRKKNQKWKLALCGHSSNPYVLFEHWELSFLPTMYQNSTIGACILYFLYTSKIQINSLPGFCFPDIFEHFLFYRKCQKLGGNRRPGSWFWRLTVRHTYVHTHAHAILKLIQEVTRNSTLGDDRKRMWGGGEGTKKKIDRKKK